MYRTRNPQLAGQMIAASALVADGVQVSEQQPTCRSDKGQLAQLTKGGGPWLGLHYHPRREMRRSEVEGDGSLVRT